MAGGKRARVLAVALGWRVAWAHSYPYQGTQMLMPSACLDQERCYAPDLGFVFGTDEDKGPRLMAFNLSTKIAAETRPQLVTAELPFLQDRGPTTAFGAARAADGSLVVHAGECDGAGPGEVWTYGGGREGEGRWTKAERARGGDEAGARPPFFLGGTIAFSSTLEPAVDRPSIYSYGGACGTPQAKGWREQANYTKSMVSMAPQGKDEYSLRVASTGGPRVPLAGFTLTPLSASISNVSGVVSQQASAVLVGGNTQQAFINMSTAAIWSLPAEAWSFVRIQPSEKPVDSRSGHTAVLREDGKALVVLGGWVGQVSTPADPQLAVLEMSQTYSSWRWAVPPLAAQPQGPGIYGHGAARLPGNIMMVYGGWQTATEGSKTKRQQADASPRFLNMTSMEWMPWYENSHFTLHDDGGYQHHAQPHDGHAAPSAEDASHNTRRLGFGIGLGLGLAIVVTVVVGLLAWRFRRRKQQQIRDDAIRDMADDSRRFLGNDAPGEKTTRLEFQWNGRDWRAGTPHGYLPQGETSSAYQGLRRSTAARKRSENRFSAVSHSTVPTGKIHPILEDDEEEEEEEETASSHHYRREEPKEPQTPTSERHSDPFSTPVSTAQPQTNQDVQEWVADVDAGHALLSRCSTRLLASPVRRNSTGLPDGLRSRASDAAPRGLCRSLTTAGYMRAAEPAKPESSSGSSYDTAQSALQTDSPSLMLSHRSPPQSPSAAAYLVDPPDDDPLSISPPKSKSSSVRRSWLGSLRHVFSSSGASSPMSAATAPDEPLSARPSLDRLVPDAQDAAHAQVGELLRRKQGPQDWQQTQQTDPGESDEWDVERAAEQRLVQVMFTVPRERLRVVNGDVENAGQRVPSGDKDDNTSAQAASRRDDDDDEHGIRGKDASPLPHNPQLQPFNDADPNHRLSHLSHSTDDTARRWSGAVYTAEAVIFERPPRRTRVLEMVESIELRRSAPSSPSPSTSTSTS